MLALTAMVLNQEEATRAGDSRQGRRRARRNSSSLDPNNNAYTPPQKGG